MHRTVGTKISGFQLLVCSPPLGCQTLWQRRSVGTMLRGAPSSASPGKEFCSHLGDPSQSAKSLDSKHVTVRPVCQGHWSQESLASGCKQWSQRPTGAGNLCSACLPRRDSDYLSSLLLFLSQEGARSLWVEGQEDGKASGRRAKRWQPLSRPTLDQRKWSFLAAS